MEIVKALSAVMADVGAIGKSERNQAQGFNFRGIDAVTNAVFPALIKHGVIVFPELNSIEYATIEVGKERRLQGHVRVQVTYTFVAASDGSKVHATVAAEAMDSGDKATAKAMSVAFRTALLQTLCLPTDEPDPDHDTYERSSVATKEVKVSKPVMDKPKPPSQQFEQRAAKGGGLNKAQQININKRVKDMFKGEDPLIVVGDIINRTITSLEDVTAEEAKVLVPRLFLSADAT